MQRLRTAYCALLVGAGVLAASPVHAQDDEDEPFFFPEGAKVIVEAHGGGSGFGRFLLQSLDSDPLGRDQRELVGDIGYSWGGSVGIVPLARTEARAAFTRSVTNLDYQDDRGTGIESFDEDDVARLSNNLLSGQAIRYLTPDDAVLAPYAGVGGVLAFWNLEDSDGDVVAGGGDDVVVRIGGIAIAGAQARLVEALSLRGEVATFALNNPFTGTESYVTDGQLVIDEPTRVVQIDVRLGLTWTFGEDRAQTLVDTLAGDDEAEETLDDVLDAAASGDEEAGLR